MGLPATGAVHGAASRLHGGFLLSSLTGNYGNDVIEFILNIFSF